MDFLKYELIMGLNDKVTKTQLIPDIEAYRSASGIVARYFDGATVYQAQGIYRHDDGTITFENSLKFDIIVFDPAKDNIMDLVAELKTTFNQESIAMQTSTVSAKLV